MGAMDCLTTVVGTVYFGTQELNPFIATLLNFNLPVFVVVKLVVTVCVGVIFVLAEKTLLSTEETNKRSFKIAQSTLLISYIGVVLFLAFIVVNNILVIVHTWL
jgi:hypothetical protein